MKQERLMRAVEQMNKLYILDKNNSSYLKQKPNGDGYYTMKARKGSPGKYHIPPLVDAHIEQHLERKATYGIILGKAGLTKFLTLDVDIEGKPEEAKTVTRELYRTLTEYYGLDEKDVHISFSGKKGYHVDLFFDKAVPYYTLLPLYEEVLLKMGETKTRIEFRPSNQGVKLPLGINQATNKFCYFANPETLEPVSDSIEYLMNIEPMGYSEFKEFVLDEVEVKIEKPKPTDFTLEHGDAEEFESLISQMNLSGKSISEIEKELTTTLLEGHLSIPNTRHRITFLLPVFFNTQGIEQPEAELQTMQVLLNTYDNHPGFINKDTSREKVISEVKRLTKLTYDKGYVLTEKRKDVQITKDEILQVLQVKKWHLKKLLLSLMIHSKRHAKADGTFYMAYSVMAKMGNTENRTRALKHLDELEKLNQIEIVSRGVVDKVVTSARGQVYCETNRYKVHTEDKGGSQSITLNANEEVNLEVVIAELFPAEEAKKILPRAQFYRTELQEAFKQKAI